MIEVAFISQASLPDEEGIPCAQCNRITERRVRYLLLQCLDKTHREKGPPPNQAQTSSKQRFILT
eukprot:5066941-Amphidinium_carterae.1